METSCARRLLARRGVPSDEAFQDSPVVAVGHRSKRHSPAREGVRFRLAPQAPTRGRPRVPSSGHRCRSCPAGAPRSTSQDPPSLLRAHHASECSGRKIWVTFPKIPEKKNLLANMLGKAAAPKHARARREGKGLGERASASEPRRELGSS